MITNKIALTAIVSAIAMGGAFGTADAKIRKHPLASSQVMQARLVEIRIHEGTERRMVERREYRKYATKHRHRP